MDTFNSHNFINYSIADNYNNLRHGLKLKPSVLVPDSIAKIQQTTSVSILAKLLTLIY